MYTYCMDIILSVTNSRLIDKFQLLHKTKKEKKTHFLTCLKILPHHFHLLCFEYKTVIFKDFPANVIFRPSQIKRRPSEALPELLLPVSPITSYESSQLQDSHSGMASLESGLSHLEVDDWDF